MFEYLKLDYLPTEKELNNYGMKGWELIYIQHQVVGYTEKYPVVIFKKVIK